MRRMGKAAMSMAAVAVLAGAVWAENGTPAAGSDDVLYEDAQALSSATILQIMPNSNKETMIVDHVRRVRVKQEVLIIEWGTTAVTLLPRQYVGSITINKRIDPNAGAATQRAAQGEAAPGGAAK